MSENVTNLLLMTDKDFYLIKELMYKEFGIFFSEQKKSMIESRLHHVINKKGFNSYSEYIEAIKKDTTNKYLSELVNYLTTNHTFFLEKLNILTF